MALSPADNETFYREVDDELRRDQMRTYWQRYGKLAIAGGILLLALLAGFLWWQNHKEVQAGERGEKLIAAFDDVASRNKPAAQAKLDELAKSGADGYRAAALLTKADLAIEAGDLKGAAGLYRQISADGGLAQPYRDLATVRMTAVEYDALQPQAVIDRLKGMLVPGNPWFGSAGEMAAIAYMRLNKPQQAARIFADIAKDKTVPDTLRSRATQMAGSLGLDAVQQADADTGRQ